MTSERRGGWEVHSGYILTIHTLEALCTPPHTTLPCFLLASQPRATPVRGGGGGFLVLIPRKTSFNRSCVGGFGQVWGKAAGMFRTTWRRTRFSFPWYATDTYARVAEVAAEGRNSKACCSWPLNSGAWTSSRLSMLLLRPSCARQCRQRLADSIYGCADGKVITAEGQPHSRETGEPKYQEEEKYPSG